MRGRRGGASEERTRGNRESGRGGGAEERVGLLEVALEPSTALLPPSGQISLPSSYRGISRSSSNLPGEFITAIGIKFRNHSVVIDGGSHRRVGSVMIDHRPADQNENENQHHHAHHAVLLVDGEFRVEREVFVDAMSGEHFGLPDAEQRIVGRVIVTTPSFSFSIFMVEEGFDEVDKRWHTAFPRRFLDLSVRLERADIATPHGVLGQSLHAIRDRKERGVPIGEAGSFSIEGRTKDYRVGRGAESLLGDSFVFNRFGSKSRK